MKKIILFILLFLIMSLIGIRFIYINKFITNLDSSSNGSKKERLRILNTKYFDANINGVGEWIIYAIEDELNWNNLPLTENFKKKFKNGNGIMPDKWKYKNIVEGRMMVEDSHTIVTLLAYHKISFFDFGNINPQMTIYYYRYQLKDNMIDDLELIRKETVSATTGNPIE